PADVVREQVVDLGPERGVAARSLPRGVELVDRRHQGLGDVLSSVLAEASVRGRGQRRDLVNRGHRGPAYHARVRAAWMNAVSLSASLTPAATSTPLATSTAHGCTCPIAAATFSG